MQLLPFLMLGLAALICAGALSPLGWRRRSPRSPDNEIPPMAAFFGRPAAGVRLMPDQNQGVAIETTSTEQGVELVFTNRFGHPTVFELSAAAAGRLAAQLARAAANAGAPKSEGSQ